VQALIHTFLSHIEVEEDFGYSVVATTFQKVLGRGRYPGIIQAIQCLGLHDLRHRFAVKSLQACPDNRDRVTQHMLALSTYLGHARMESTYW